MSISCWSVFATKLQKLSFKLTLLTKTDLACTCTWYSLKMGYVAGLSVTAKHGDFMTTTLATSGIQL